MTLRLVASLVLVVGIVAGGRAAAAPPAPTPVGPANGANVLVPFTISWSAVIDPSGAGITGYNWKVSPSSTLTPVILRDSTNSNVTQDTVSGLPNGTYFWQVQAANSAGEQGAWSQAQSFTVTGVGPGTPGTPTLAPTRGYSTFHPEEVIHFDWSAVPDAVTYRLEVSDDPSFPLDRVLPDFQTFWTDNIPTNTDGFRWGQSLGEGTFLARVFAVNADNPQQGIRSLPSNVITFTVFYNNPLPPPPSPVSPANGTTLTLPITLTWTDVPNPQPSGYDGQISGDPSFSTNEAPLFVQLSQPLFNILSLTPGTKFWRVRSNQGLASPNPPTNAVTAWSATGTFTISTAPSTPVSIALEGVPLPQTVYSGVDRWVAVQLTAGVPASGATIALASSDPAAAPVPQTIMMPGTHAWTQFQMQAGQVTLPTLVTLTATLNGVSASGQFTVLPPSLKSLTITPIIINGGAQAGGSVQLNGQAPAGGAVVGLSSSSPAAIPPATVTVPAGSFSVPFSMPTSAVATDTTATITASWNGISVQSLLTVSAQVAVPTSLTLLPSWVIGGEGSSTGTVTVASPAAPFDRFLQVTSNNPAILPFLSNSVMVPAGSTSGNFSILHRFVTVPTVVTISVTGGGVTHSADLSVNPAGTPPPPPALSSFTVSPASVSGGSPSTGTVTLPSAAPAGGTVVTLSSNLPGSASVPPSVTVLASATSASFTVTTFNVAPTTVQLTARLGDTILFAPITINSPASSPLNAVTVNPASVVGGNSATGTVTLAAATPSPAVVSLSDNSTAVSVPVSVTVPTGATSATFTITTTSVTASTSAVITAIYGPVTQTAALTVNPAPPPTPTAPSLVSPAADATPAQPVTFDWSDVANATSYEIQVDDSSTIAAPFRANQIVSVSQATIGGLPAQRLWWRVRAQNSAGVFGPFSATRRFTPQAAPAAASLSAVSVSPTSVVGGNTSQGTVTLTGAAPSGGALVTLSSSSSSATVPANVNVAAGATTASFTVTTASVTAAATATITGSFGGVSRTAVLTVNPPAATGPTLSAVTVNPTSVVGGSPSTGTATLSAAAPSGGAVVTLSDNSTAASVPASVTVPAGATSANFTVTTTSVTASTSATISAVFAGVTRTAVLTVMPASGGTLPAPTLVSPANDARFSPGQAITFDWSDVSGAVSYTIQIDDADTFPAPQIVNQTVTVFQYTNSTLPTTRMWFRVRATDAAGTAGAWSAVRRFEVK